MPKKPSAYYLTIPPFAQRVDAGDTFVAAMVAATNLLCDFHEQVQLRRTGRSSKVRLEAHTKLITDPKFQSLGRGDKLINVRRRVDGALVAVIPVVEREHVESNTWVDVHPSSMGNSLVFVDVEKTPEQKTVNGTFGHPHLNLRLLPDFTYKCRVRTYGFVTRSGFSKWPVNPWQKERERNLRRLLAENRVKLSRARTKGTRDACKAEIKRITELLSGR